MLFVRMLGVAFGLVLSMGAFAGVEAGYNYDQTGWGFAIILSCVCLLAAGLSLAYACFPRD